VSRRIAFALALLWLLLGFANVARGLAHTGAHYRFWSFQNFCYSDVIAMHGDRYLGGGHPRPYLDDRIEYPVLLGLALWLPHWVPGGAAGHFIATYLFLAACLFAALLALDRTPGASPAWLAATPALTLYAALNWDLLPIALLAIAVMLHARGRTAGAAAMTGLGISAKLFPGVLVLPAAGALAGARGRGAGLRALLWSGLALAGVVVVVNAPIALAAPGNWAWFFAFNAGRGAENSIWNALGVGSAPWLDARAGILHPNALLELLSTGPLLAASAAALAGAYFAARRGDESGRAVRLGAALALTVWIATNKIWSPQYALYGFLAGAMVSAPWPLFGALTAASLFDFWAAFEVRALRWQPAFRDGIFHPEGVVRSVLWLALAAWIARELWRVASQPAEGVGAPRECAGEGA
jgi:hypothetical protein